MSDQNKNTTLESAFLVGCPIFLLGCFLLFFTKHLQYNLPFFFASWLELFLLALIFIGLPSKILTKRFFNKYVLSCFNKSSIANNSKLLPDLSKYESIGLLIYWLEVVITFIALRLLQLAEYSDFNYLTISTSLIWLFALYIYWRYILNRIIEAGYKSNPSNETYLQKAVDNEFISITNLLFIGDCVLWIIFTLLPGPPSGGLVICLFLFTGVALIDEYTMKSDPFQALLKDKYRSIGLILLGGLCFWLQWGENDMFSIWSFYNQNPPLHGVFYPILTYVAIILIAIWRGGERHFFKSNELRVESDAKQHLLSLLEAAFHNLKKESDSLLTYCNIELEVNLSPTTYFRVENMAMSVAGMYVAVKNIKYEMTICRVNADDKPDLSKGIVNKLLFNIVNNVEYAMKHEKGIQQINSPDRGITDVVSELGLFDLEKRNGIIEWSSDTHEYWTVLNPKDEKICNLIPDRSGIGLLRSLLSEIIRNALRHNPYDNPFLKIKIWQNYDYLQFDIMNKCEDPNYWQEIKDGATTYKRGGGSQALYFSAKALSLKLQYEALENHIARVSLGVKIA